jgi:hypothetical protein
MHVVVVVVAPNPSIDGSIDRRRPGSLAPAGRENDLASDPSELVATPGGRTARVFFQRPARGAAHATSVSFAGNGNPPRPSWWDGLERLWGKAALRYSSPSPFGRTGIPRRRSRLFHLGASCRRRYGVRSLDRRSARGFLRDSTAARRRVRLLVVSYRSLAN